MSSNRPQPDHSDGGRRGRSYSNSNYTKNKYDGYRPPSGAGWRADVSFGVSANRSLSEDRRTESRDRSYRNMSQHRGRFYSDACAEAYKDKISRAPQSRDSSSSPDEAPLFNERNSVSNNYHRGRPSDNRNENYGGANKSFDQMVSRRRAENDSFTQQYRNFSQYRGESSQRARSHSTTYTYNQQPGIGEQFHGQRSHSRTSFDDRRHFVNDRSTNNPRQTSSDWKTSRQQKNYGRVHESQMQNHNPSTRSDSNGRSSSAGNRQFYPKNKNNSDSFRGLQNFGSSRQNYSFGGPASSSSSSQYKYSQNRNGSYGSGTDANTAFYQNDTNGSDWANTSILAGPSDRQQRVKNKSRGKSSTKPKGLTTMHARYGNNKKANATYDRIIEYVQDQSSVFNQTQQNLSETIAEDVSISYADQSYIKFDGDLTMDDDVFDTTGHLDTSVLPTVDLQDALNGSFIEGVSSGRIRSNSFNNGTVTKKKRFHKTKIELNQSFAGFEIDGPSPIQEVDEEADSPIKDKVKEMSPLRISIDINKMFDEDHDLPMIHSPRVKIELPCLKALIREEGDSDDLFGFHGRSHEFYGRSQSCESVFHLLLKEEVKEFHKLKRTKSCDVLTVGLKTTRDTTTVYDRSGLSIWSQELPFKEVAPAEPTTDWRYFTKMDKMALPFTLESLRRVGRFIVHRGFVPKMPYLLVINNFVFYFSDGAAYQMMPPKFEFHLLPYSPCPEGEVVSGLYEYIDKNEEEFHDYKYRVDQMTRVTNKAPDMRWKEDLPLKKTNVHVNMFKK